MISITFSRDNLLAPLGFDQMAKGRQAADNPAAVSVSTSC
jgi:hypothetical protein